MTRRSRRFVVAMAALVGCAACLVGLAYIGNHRPPPAPHVTQASCFTTPVYEELTAASGNLSEIPPDTTPATALRMSAAAQHVQQARDAMPLCPDRPNP